MDRILKRQWLEEVAGIRDGLQLQMRELEQLEESLRLDGLSPDDVRERLRRFKNTKSESNRLAPRATTVALRAERQRSSAAMTPAPVPMAATVTRVGASISHAQRAVQVRVAEVISQPPAEVSPLELGWLIHQQSTLGHHAEVLPEDSLLLESVLEFSERVTRLLKEFPQNQKLRVQQWTAFLRDLISQMRVSGALDRTKAEQAKVAVTKASEAHPRDLERLEAALDDVFLKLWPVWLASGGSQPISLLEQCVYGPDAPRRVSRT